MGPWPTGPGCGWSAGAAIATAGALGIYSEKGPEYDYDLQAIQGGFDIYRAEGENGVRDHAGIYGVFGQARGEVDHIGGRRAGTVRIDGSSLGAYWTRFWRNGAYLDGVAQYTWFDGQALSPRMPALKGDARGYAVSLEGAYPLRFRQDWVVEPQAQLTYQRFDGEPTSDIAAEVDFEDTDSLIGRLGLRVARTLVRGEGSERLESTGWLRANYSHEFMDDPTTTFSSEDGPVVFQSDLGSDWLELNGGFTHQITPDAAFYGGVGYQWNLDNDGHAWNGKIGMRFNW